MHVRRHAVPLTATDIHIHEIHDVFMEEIMTLSGGHH